MKSIKISALALTLAFAAPSVFAQTTPVPHQLKTATRVFLASGGSTGIQNREQEITAMVYTDLYRALSSTNRYKMENGPTDAEIAMTVSTHSEVTIVMSGGSLSTTFLQLDIEDIQTHTLLWTIDEPLQGAFREKTFQRNVDAAIAALMQDLQTLADGKVPGALPLEKANGAPATILPSQTTALPKTRFQQQPKD